MAQVNKTYAYNREDLKEWGYTFSSTPYFRGVPVNEPRARGPWLLILLPDMLLVLSLPQLNLISDLVPFCRCPSGSDFSAIMSHLHLHAALYCINHNNINQTKLYSVRIFTFYANDSCDMSVTWRMSSIPQSYPSFLIVMRNLENDHREISVNCFLTLDIFRGKGPQSPNLVSLPPPAFRIGTKGCPSVPQLVPASLRVELSPDQREAPQPTNLVHTVFNVGAYDKDASGGAALLLRRL